MRAARFVTATLVVALLRLGAAGPAAQTTTPRPTGPTSDDFFNSAVLQRLDILINSKDWEKLKANYLSNEYYPADIKWQNITVRNVGIRSRGLGSRSQSKPALRVDMNRYTSGQTFLDLKAFAMDNQWQDPSGIKEVVSMKFYRRLGLPAPRESFAMVYVNNKYAGVYALMEEIGKDFLKRVYGEKNGDTENDGNLYEYHWKSPWYFTYLGADFEPYKTILEEKEHDKKSDYDKYHDLVEWIRTTNDVSDSQFIDAVWKYIDLNTFVKTIAAESLMAEWDGIVGYAGMANFWLYRFEQTTQHQFIIWDSDNTFRAIDYPVLQGQQDNVLMRRTMSYESLRRTFYERLWEAVLSAQETDPAETVPAEQSRRGWLEREVDAALTLIQQAMYADPNKPYTNKEFDDAAAYLRQFAKERPVWVKCEVARTSGGVGTLGPECF